MELKSGCFFFYLEVFDMTTTSLRRGRRGGYRVEDEDKNKGKVSLSE
jgi:hypothetical protein